MPEPGVDWVLKNEQGLPSVTSLVSTHTVTVI